MKSSQNQKCKDKKHPLTASTMVNYNCPFCNFYCRSKAGQTQHIQQKPACLRAQKESLGLTSAPPRKKAKIPPEAAASTVRKTKSVSFHPFKEQVKFISPRNPKKRDAASLEQLSPEEEELAANVRGLVEEDQLARAQLFGELDNDELDKDADLEDNRKMAAEERHLDDISEDDDEAAQQWQDPDDYFAQEEAEHLARTQAEVRNFMENDNVPLQPTLAHLQQQQQQQVVLQGLFDDDWNNDRIINAKPNTKMRDGFREYCESAQKKYIKQLSKDQQRGVKLLHVLKQKKSPLDGYAAIMDWHYRDKGAIKQHERLKDVRGYVSRDVLMDTIKYRYNMGSKFPKTVPLTLPVSRAHVNLTTHTAWDCIESLLTDPRVDDDDYNFVDNDPFAPPEKNPAKIGDFHTARAHREAYAKYITDPTKQILMPFQFYIDGACTGQFQNLPITQLKMALGIHTRKYRQNEWAWRTLGHVANVSKPNSRGKAKFTESGHIDAEVENLMEGEGAEAPASKLNIAQDFHAMLEVILESFLDVQQNGFIWDLRYRGRTYKDVEFVPYVVFVKCDTDEGDLLCGSFKTRTGNVKNLCRYCTCPTKESDLVNAKFPFKTVSMIKPSILIRDEEGLRKISQQLIENAWYKVRFSPESSRGIHGATPSEMLHAILLGLFKYAREMFFEQVGPTSKMADEINAIAQKYGVQFGRQSGRDLPKCKFKQGIRKGKLQAKEFRGILLVMAAVLRSTMGVETLKENKNFKNDFAIKDWSLLVELLLEWEAFLCEPEMKVSHVMKLQQKNRYIMYLMKSVGRRTTGMGLKLMKFHVVIHLAWDIILFGVPLEVDTGFNESHHKGTKVAARLTQKNESTFDFQTCTRLDEFFTLDLAMEEIRGRRLCDYFSRPATSTSKSKCKKPTIKTCGLEIWAFRNEETNEPSYSTGKVPKAPSSVYWGADIVQFLVELQEKLVNKKLLTGHLQIRGTHKRNGHIFRGQPQYRGEYWRDWALIDWGDATRPGQIWCFVVIKCIPTRPGKKRKKGKEKAPVIEKPSGIFHGDVEVQNGVYAVVESSEYQTDQKMVDRSDIFIPIVKDVVQVGNKNRPWKRKFYLADVEAIHKPLVVVPDIGCKSKRDYFVVKPRNEWVEMFEGWLDDDPVHDVIGDDEPVPSHIVDNTY